jgi:sortase A
MNVRTLERILLLIGVTLLGTWSAAQLYRSARSRVAVERFESKASISSVEDAAPSFDPGLASTLDFRLWSDKRIKAFRESLAGKTDLPLAILRIPTINLEAPLFNDTDDLTLDRGLGRILGTAHLGQAGNLGIAGHRDGFFRGLKDVKLGDSVELNRPGFTDEYVIGKIQIVEPDDVQVLASTHTPALTLVTCFPFYYVGRAPKRYIVTAYIADSNPNVRAASESLVPMNQKY